MPAPPTCSSMREVIAHENAIREYLKKKKDKEATAIMTGTFPAKGTRLDALKEIVKRLKLTVK
jgi:hypothetical protein